MLITFSGLDGAGKSTVIAWLRDELTRQRRQVRVFHMNDDVGVYAYLRALRDRVKRIVRGNGVAPSGGAPPTAPVRRPLARGRAALRARLGRVREAILWNKPIRRALYPVDLLIFLAYRLYFERIRGEVLIMDRYFYDTLVDLADGGSFTGVRLLERLTPTPQLPVFLDVTPLESFLRKGEYSVEYLQRRWVAYRRIAPWIRTAVVLLNKPLSETEATLRVAVQERLPR